MILPAIQKRSRRVSPHGNQKLLKEGVADSQEKGEAVNDVVVTVMERVGLQIIIKTWKLLKGGLLQR